MLTEHEIKKLIDEIELDYGNPDIDNQEGVYRAGKKDAFEIVLGTFKTYDN